MNNKEFAEYLISKMCTDAKKTFNKYSIWHREAIRLIVMSENTYTVRNLNWEQVLEEIHKIINKID